MSRIKFKVLKVMSDQEPPLILIKREGCDKPELISVDDVLAMMGNNKEFKMER